MGNYLFHYISGGRLEKTEEKTFGDDLEALELARKMSASLEVVVWDRDRFVARVRRNDAAPTALDRDGG